MKMTILSYNAVAAWRWNASTEPHQLYVYATRGPNGALEEPDDDDDEVCGICQAAFEATCPECKVPGDDCPLSKSTPIELSHKWAPWGLAQLLVCVGGRLADSLSVWGECSHIFHMHCLLKWLETESSKQQCPMDRRPWGERMWS